MVVVLFNVKNIIVFLPAKKSVGDYDLRATDMPHERIASTRYRKTCSAVVIFPINIPLQLIIQPVVRCV